MTRTGLLLGTAIAAALLAGRPAAAQFPFITDIDVTAGGGAPAIADIGNTRIITLNAPRTYFDHGQGFFLASNETVRFNFANPGPGGVALLRSDAGFGIFGILEGRLGPAATDPLGGNLWLFSRNGIFVAEGGRIAAGGILLSNAMPQALLSAGTRQALLADSALTIEALLPPFTTGGIQIVSGASLEAGRGFLAMVAQDVTIGAGTQATAAGTALFGAARGYRLQLARNASSDFDMVEFAIPAGFGTDSGAPALIDLSGTVTGGRVHMALVNAGNIAGALVQAPGTLIATEATADGHSILLSAGAGIAGNRPAAPLPGESVGPTRFEAGVLESAGDIMIFGTGSATVAAARAVGDVILRQQDGFPDPSGIHAFGTIEAGRDSDLAAERIAVLSLAAGRDARVTAAESASVDTTEAGDDILFEARQFLQVGDVRSTRLGDDNPDEAAGGRFLRLTDGALGDDGFVLLSGGISGFDAALVSAGGFDLAIALLPGQVLADLVLRGNAGGVSRVAATGTGTLDAEAATAGPLFATAEDRLQLRVDATGFAYARAGGDLLVADARVRADRANPGTLALESDAGAVVLGRADADGDIYLLARRGEVVAGSEGPIRVGDDLYAISVAAGDGVRLLSDADVKPGFEDRDGNQVLVGGDPTLLIRDFTLDIDGNGRRLELLAPDQFGQGSPGTGGSLSARGSFLGFEAFVLAAPSGDVDFDAAALTGAPVIAATAGRDLTVAGPAFQIAFNAERDVRLLAREAGLELFESAAGRDLSVAAAGPVRLALVTATRDVVLQGTEIDIRDNPFQGLRNLTLDTIYGFAVVGISGGLFAGDLSVSGTIRLLSLAGTSELGNLAAGEDIIAETGFILLGDLAAGAAIDMRVNGVEAGVVRAGGAIGIVSQGGDIDIAATEAGGDLTVSGEGSSAIRIAQATSATGDVLLEGATVESLLVRAESGSVFATGRSGPVALGLDGGVEAGLDLVATGTVLELVAARAGRDVVLTATAGDLVGPSFAAVRDLSLSASGRVAAGQATAGRDLALAAGTRLEVGGVEAGRDVDLSGGEMFALAVRAGRDVTAALSGPLQADIVSGGDDVRIAAGGVRANLVLQSTGAGEDSEGDGRNILLVAPGGVSVGTGPDGFLGAPDDVVVRAGPGDFQMPSAAVAQAGRDLVIEAGTATMGFAEAGRDLRLALAQGGGGAGGFLSRRRFAAGRDLQIVSGGALVVDALEAGGSLSVEVAGRLGAGPATAGLDLAIAAEAIGPSAFAAFAARAGRDVRIASAGGVDGGGPLAAGRDATVSADGTVRFASMEAGDDLAVAAGSGDILSSATRATGLGPDSEGDGSNIRLSGRDAALGAASAARDLEASLTGSLGAQGLETGRDALLTAQGIVIDATPAIGRDLVIAARGGPFQALEPLAAGRDVIVREAADIRLGAVTAGRDIGLSGSGALETGLLAAPGRLSAEAASMTIGGAALGGGAALLSTGGGIELAGPFAAGGDVRLAAPDAPAGILRIGRLDAGGTVEASAFSILSADGGGFVRAGGGVRLAGTGNQTIELDEVVSDDDVDLTSPVIRVGLVRATGLGPDRDGDGFNIRMRGGLGAFGTLDAPTDILARFTDELAVAVSARAGRDALLVAGNGALALGGTTAGGVATLVGGSLELRETLAAAELRLVSTGPMRFGGSAGGTGFVFSAADLARVSAPGGISASTGAVPRAATAQGPASAAFEAQYGVGASADLRVDSFAFDPKAVARFGFFAGAAARILVVGDVAPSAAGGRITLGANPVEGLTPGAVLVSGSLGSGALFLQDCYVALLPLENLAITALGDVIFGNAAFQQAVAAADPAAIDVQAGTPGLPPSPADDRLWVVAETMSIAAPGRIVAQNTSSVPGSYAGLVLANRQSGPLVPTVLTVTGGSVVDLSGVVVNGVGRAFFGPQAARSGAILATLPQARFNSCSVAGLASCLPPLADPGLGFRPEQFVPPDPVPPEPGLLRGEILFLFDEGARLRVLEEDGAIFLRRDEEEERMARPPVGR